jgi:hypothetical protein
MAALLHGVILAGIVAVIFVTSLTVARRLSRRLRPGCSENSAPPEGRPNAQPADAPHLRARDVRPVGRGTE